MKSNLKLLIGVVVLLLVSVLISLRINLSPEVQPTIEKKDEPEASVVEGVKPIQSPSSELKISEVLNKRAVSLKKTDTRSPNKRTDYKRTKSKNRPKEIDFIKNKYQFSDEQIDLFNQNGFSSKDIIRIQELSKLTNKSVEELVDAWGKTHVGWGNFIHDLKVPGLKLNMIIRKEMADYAKVNSPKTLPPGLLNAKPAKSK